MHTRTYSSLTHMETYNSSALLQLLKKKKKQSLEFPKEERRNKLTSITWVKLLLGVVKMQLFCTHVPQQLAASVLYS